MDASPPPPSEPDLGAYIRQLRQAAHISQRTLAGRVGIDVTYLSKLENGRQGASEHVLRSLAEALEVPVPRMLMLAGRVPEELRSAIAARANDEARLMLADARPATRLLVPPRYLTSFTNRTLEMSRFQDIWRQGAVITISGPAGCGKSRFAAEVLNHLDADGLPVSWVPVEPGDDSARIRALTLAAETGPGAVVVLDNADLAIEASADVAKRLVYANSALTVVATSRQPLDIHGEQLLRLHGLNIPDLHLRPDPAPEAPTPDLERLRSQESLSLFVDRARLAEPGFQLDIDNAAAVFDICLWLDGLPLAIELAALRLRHMTVGDLAVQIGDPRMLGLLAGNTPDVPFRHASMETAIAWSFDQLTAAQRTVAVRLCRFSAPFRRVDAAQVVSDGELSAEEVGQIVLELVDRSLLVKIEDRDHHAAYRWPRPIQQYGLNLLRSGPDGAETDERYGTLCRRFLESLRDQHSFTVADWTRLADLSEDMYDFLQGVPAAERRRWLAALRNAWPSLLRFGNRTSQRLGAVLQESEVFHEPGIQARVRGDYEAAHELYRAEHERATDEHDASAQADTLQALAQNAADSGRYSDAEEHLQRAEELYDELGNRRGLTEVKNLWGILSLVRSDPEAAEQLFLEALRLSQEQESLRLEAYSLHNLGLCDSMRRRVASARARLERSLSIREHMGNLRGMARVIEVFALVESETGNHPVAMELLGAALQYRHSSQTLGRPQWWRDRIERVDEEARSALAAQRGEADRFMRLGAALSLSEAGELATQSVQHSLRGELGEAHSRALRRVAPLGTRPLNISASALLDSRRGESAVPLEASIQALADGQDLAPEVRRGVREAELYALAERDGSDVDDLLCFAVSPNAHRGVIVPLFTRASMLSPLLDRNREWASKQVLSVGFDQLRVELAAGETIVINPWSPSEYRWTASDEGYLPQDRPLTPSS